MCGFTGAYHLLLSFTYCVNKTINVFFAKGITYYFFVYPNANILKKKIQDAR